MRYYIIAGEASGDLHAAHLMRALRQRDAKAEFRGIGGEHMQAEGLSTLLPASELAVMGFLAVVRHLPSLVGHLRRCRRDIVEWQPHVLLLVDSSGFNLRVARHVRRHHPSLPIAYFIPPKLWAWREGRMAALRRCTDRLLCILPFEVDYYAQRHAYHQAVYVGNPTVAEVAEYVAAHPANFELFTHAHALDSRPILALLPGSRRQEIRFNLPRMMAAAEPYANRFQLVIAAAPGIDAALYAPYDLPLCTDTYALLQHSHAALVTSGTATLEAALFAVPQVVCYRTRCGRLVRWLRRRLLRVPHVSLVNLIAQQDLVPELIAADMTVARLRQELQRLLCDEEARSAQLNGYALVRNRLGNANAASEAARQIESMRFI